MPDNTPWQILKRFVHRVTKAKDRPSPRFRSFASSFSALLNNAEKPLEEIVTFLLTESLRHQASDIHIEPGQEGVHDIFFRVDGVLHKAAIAKGKGAKRVRAALLGQSHNQRQGQYNVRESTLTTSEQGKKFSFSLYDIPQAIENCLLIRPANTTPTDHTGPAPRKSPTSTRNIEKKIFIWQMGKVGSLAVHSSLYRFTKPSVWQVPSIKYDTHWPKSHNVIQTHSIKLLYDFLHYSDEEFVIISLVRDLLARNISSIFQSMTFTEEWRNQFYIASAREFQKMPYERQEQAIARHLHTLNTSTLATGWYDNLLRSHFYYPDIEKYFIDIYAKPFDQEKGFQTYESKTPRVQLIILRMEDLNARGKELGDFLGVKDFQPVWGNTPEGKWYAPIYKRFKERYRPTTQELEAIYGSKFMQYFYSQEQIMDLMAKWSKQ